MRFIRGELHNHSTHSDGSMTVEQLAAYAQDHQFGILALTDHNTVSGHLPCMEAIRQGGYTLSLLPGVEVTTPYGHILALGLTHMVDFTGLNPHAPQKFFQGLKEAGAQAVGIAHPFCIGRPVMAGCRLALDMKDWEHIDYIEIANTAAEDSFSGNAQALAHWESLVLGGKRIAAVSGKDLHGEPKEQIKFSTFAPAEEGGTDAQAMIGAILTQRTFLSKGPLFTQREENGLLILDFFPSDYLRWESRRPRCHPLVTWTDSTGEMQLAESDLLAPLSFPLHPGTKSGVIKIYDSECAYERLLAVAGYCCQGKELTP